MNKCKNKAATEYGWVKCGSLCGGTFRYCEECEDAGLEDANVLLDETGGKDEKSIR